VLKYPNPAIHELEYHLEHLEHAPSPVDVKGEYLATAAWEGLHIEQI